MHWHAVGEHSGFAGSDTLITSDAAVGILDYNVLMPQKSYFPDDIPRALIDTFPARGACFGIDPYVRCMDTIEFFLYIHFNRDYFDLTVVW